MQLSIPEKHAPVLARIRALSVEQVSELLAALRNAPRTPKAEDIVANISPLVTSIENSELKSIVETICTLYSVRAANEISVKGFASDLAKAMRRIDSGAPVSSEEENLFRRRMQELLSIEGLGSISKGLGLELDHERVFCNARIITDLRPLFEKPGERPVGAVVTHTLKLTYHEGDEHKSLFVGLNSHDLDRLRRLIERAEQKAASLGSLMEEARITDYTA